MFKWLVACLTLLAAVSAAFCAERKDPFDEYIYHAPRLDGIVCDGDPGDWPDWLPWEGIDHQLRCSGSMCWPGDTLPGITPPTSAEDFSDGFKACWGMVEDWPVLYLLVEWIDNEFHFDPEGSWNTSDLLELWYGERLYDYDRPLSRDEALGAGSTDYVARQAFVFLVEGWGIRTYVSGQGFVEDEGQPYTTSAWQMAGPTKAYIECQVQMVEDYREPTPWEVESGATCLALTFSPAADYDPSDGSYSYMTWGLSTREYGGLSALEDIRMMFSTIAFEPADYYTAAKTSTWGEVKSVF